MRWIVALVVALFVAQIGHARVLAQPGQERAITDATLWINPPSAPDMCVLLGAGRLTVSGRIERPAIERRPTSLTLHGMMEDAGTNVVMRLSEAETTTTTQIGGGRYCWAVTVDAPETEGMPNAQRGAYTLNVAVRITHTPE